ncbi:MAG TPA: hypothetical protein VL068_10050 [Microthrixaceae bacterium]|nr:hypothetical protein [Microthrixaceae bacterium]
MPLQPSSLDPLTPILVGVGVAQHNAGQLEAPGSSDFSDTPTAIDLMEQALRNALSDTGVTSASAANPWLSRISTVAVTEGDWAYGDPGGELARRLGIKAARSIRVDVGVPQHTPIAAALRGIRNGTVQAAVVSGGEAKATQMAMRRAGLDPWGTVESEPDLAAAVPDERWKPQGEIMAQAEIDVGMWSAVEHYACIEATLRHAEGQGIDDHLDDIAELWHGFNQVAVDNPRAAFPEPRSIEFLRQAGVGNRPLAYPYAKWHSTQWAVDQAAALLLCSAEVAEELGVPKDRWLFPRVALESSFSLSLTKRANMHRWEAMGVLGAAAAEHLGRPLDEVEHVELYSCFPSAVRVQQRELDLQGGPLPTITGGMAFAGGPFNNFTYQSTAAMAERLRDDPGSLGMVTTVSGLLTKPALAVWSTDPGPPLVEDLASTAESATEQREVARQSDGLDSDAVANATIASLTVTYTGEEAASAFVIADLSDGRRWIGTSDDPDLLSEAQRSELIGQKLHITGSTCQL